MQLRQNAFKDALRASRPQIGLWVGLADAYVTELLATSGFDWLALDAEHAPNDPRSILAQLQAMAPYPVHAVVRTASGDATLIKQYLDIGAQTLLIPMVESASRRSASSRPLAIHLRASEAWAARWRVLRAGIKSPTTCSVVRRKPVFWSRWNPPLVLAIFRRSPQPRA